MPRASGTPAAPAATDLVGSRTCRSSGAASHQPPWIGQAPSRCAAADFLYPVLHGLRSNPTTQDGWSQVAIEGSRGAREPTRSVAAGAVGVPEARGMLSAVPTDSQVDRRSHTVLRGKTTIFMKNDHFSFFSYVQPAPGFRSGLNAHPSALITTHFKTRL